MSLGTGGEEGYVNHEVNGLSMVFGDEFNLEGGVRGVNGRWTGVVVEMGEEV